jgi:hypothetical protein
VLHLRVIAPEELRDGAWAVAAQSAAQLAVNLVGITVAGMLVLRVYQRA